MITAKHELTTLLTGGAFFESPRWHEGSWYVSDVLGNDVRRVGTDGREEVVLTLGGQPSGLGWLPDGALLVVSMHEHAIYRQSTDGDLSRYADVSEYSHGLLNDMVVDAAGGVYVGSTGVDMAEGGAWRAVSLIRVDPDGSVRPVADDMYGPNGMAITPDRRTLIVGESFAQRYTAFTIESDGTLTERRIWGQLAPAVAPGPVSELAAQLEIAPDGCALDADDNIWMADMTGGPVRRLAPNGATTDEVPPPGDLIIFACMLGGEDGRTLLMCAAPQSVRSHGAVGRYSCLVTTRVDTPRSGLP